MRMKKRIALVQTLFLILALSACGANDGKTDSIPNEAESVPETVSEASVSTPEEADSTAPILDRLLGKEGKVYNIYAGNRKLLNILRTSDPEYEENSLSENSAAVSDNAASDNSEDDEQKSTDETVESGKIGDVTVRWHIFEDSADEYEKALDKALVNKSASADDQVDLFIVDGDMTAKYADATANVALPLSQIGLNEADLGQQYEFTKTVGSDEKNVQRAFTWEVPCGIFAYRRSAAESVLGTDNPVQVQEYIRDWDSFRSTAALAGAKGYHMLSGYTDAYYVYLGMRKEGWVDDEEQMTVDPEMAAWVHTTKDFSEKGYNNGRTGFHDADWQQDVRNDQKLFGTFLTASDVGNYLLGDDAAENESVSSDNGLPADQTDPGQDVISENAAADRNSEAVGQQDISGDWAVCNGPSVYCQGGDWIFAAAGSDNSDLTCDLIRRLFCSEDVMSQITRDTGEMTNHMAAMKTIAGESLFGNGVFGAQNYIRVYDTAARSCEAGKRTLYDHEINEAFINAFLRYFSGETDEGTALNEFYTETVNEFPDLSY